MKTRDRKRRPRGGPNPGRLRATKTARYWLNYLSAFRTSSRAGVGGRAVFIVTARANRCMTPRERRYVRIRLKEAKP